jgi:hypothetical protein
MSVHVTSEDVERFRRGELPPAEAAAFGRHAQECAACAALLEPHLFAAAARVRGALQKHLDPDAQLFPFVAGRLDAAAREVVEEHLASCAECRQDVAELRAVETSVASRRAAGSRRVAWIAVAAAAAAVGIVWGPGLLRQRDIVTAPERRVAPEAPVDPAVNEALRRGALVEPAIVRQLRGSGSHQRGPADSPVASMNPAGIVVETARPRFTWSAPERGLYEVSVYDGTKRIAASGPLRETQWSPDRDLPRGRTYAWQVETQRGERVITIPAAADPPALFHVLDETQWRAIDEARRRSPIDHRLLGVLYAKAGMRAAAEAELEAAVRARQQGAEVLLRSVRSWPAP